MPTGSCAADAERGRPSWPARWPLARAWLLQIEAEALNRSGQRAAARAALEQALAAARAIPVEEARQRNVDKISRALR